MSWDVEVIVVGAGHAGAEAALAAARLGAETLLVTLDVDAACKMSCNPAIGGIAKGQMVRELDALGGEMALAADACGIHFRMLNTRKGPAVHSPRAQQDKERYSRYFRRVLTATPRLHLLHDEVTELLAGACGVRGVRVRSGAQYHAPAIVLTTGTFLAGRLYIGDEKFTGGRSGEIAADDLAASLRDNGLELGRLKTGTPPRLLASSIDFGHMQVQEPDAAPQPFSFRTAGIGQPQVPCYITHTTEATRQVIQANLHRSPLFAGKISGIGPRYCPSIEDKVVRFPQHPRHTVFIEPEGMESNEYYPNGISSSLPADVQQEIVRSIPGLENAVITRWAYAVEYDFVRTRQLQRTLECKRLAGLFLAGQINGTSGYEEAAVQGLLAGINAYRRLRGVPAIILERRTSYIGVLVDDLVTHDITEPYRMFTSRAEHRLHLRHDNADRRLLPVSREVRLLPADVLAAFERKSRSVDTALAVLSERRRSGKPLIEHLRAPQAGALDLCASSSARGAGEDAAAAVFAELGLSAEESRQALLDARYAGYLKRQRALVAAMERWDSVRLPADLDYSLIPGLRTESRLKLQQSRPATLADVVRITGVTPADAAIVEVYLRSRWPARQPRREQACG